MKVYKVVKVKIGGNYQSCRASNWYWYDGESASFCLTYETNKFTADVDRGMFCFKSLPSAQLFAVEDDIIFVAEGRNVRAVKYVSCTIPGVRSWWNLRKRKMRIKEVSQKAPKGTCLASHIKLLHKVVE